MDHGEDGGIPTSAEDEEEPIEGGNAHQMVVVVVGKGKGKVDGILEGQHHSGSILRPSGFLF